ncbi:MAG: hypothetical protein HY049_05495 [Acidobacteria bacterium]|nr:hypothetical protein [Acidobacteriota bacterium]
MIATFLLQLGAGCLLGLLPVPARATGMAFNRFVAGLGAFVLMLGVGASFQSAGRTPTAPVWGLAIVAALLSAALAHMGRVEGSRLPARLAASCAVAAMVLDASALAKGAASPGGMTAARYVLDAVSSAWLLGSVLIAMILGHYYLNIAGLAIDHLVRLCLVSMAAVGLRTLVAAWGLAHDGPGLIAPWLQGGLEGGGEMLSIVVLLQRLLFGILGAALLTTMAWRTARINSTQSATGILYIGFIAVIVGELASRYLLFGTGRPL